MTIIKARCVAASRAHNCRPIYSLVGTYPRFIHAEGKTHRLMKIDSDVVALEAAISLMDEPLFSRNASSSRAVPTSKLLREAIETPAMPIEWHYNQPGMQGGTLMSDADATEAKRLWLLARDHAVAIAQQMLESTNPHKQTINRLLEPFTHITTIITATEWSNFLDLRLDAAADPTMRRFAEKVRDALISSEPITLEEGQWHTPFYGVGRSGLEEGRWVSAGRCARVSYLNHDGSTPDDDKDIRLANLLWESKHLSPFEHQARPAAGERHAVLWDWQSQRTYLAA